MRLIRRARPSLLSLLVACVLLTPANAVAEPPLQDDALAEAQALARAKRHVAEGGAVDAALRTDTLQGLSVQGITRLHEAAAHGWTRVAKFLLEKGADPLRLVSSTGSNRRLTPIRLACLGGHTETLTLLKQSAWAEVGVERKIRIDLERDPKALAMVAFDEATWRAVHEEEEGAKVSADLIINVKEGRFFAMASDFDAFQHVGADAAVAMWEPSEWPSARMPRQVVWLESLPNGALKPGKTFLVRTSARGVFGVRVESWDPAKDQLVLNTARVSTRFDRTTPPPVCAPAAVGFITIASARRGPAFMGVSVSRSSKAQFDSLAGTSAERAAWMKRMGLERVTFEEREGVVERIRLELATPAPEPLLQKALGIAPAGVQKELLEDGATLATDRFAGVAYRRGAQGMIETIDLMPASLPGGLEHTPDTAGPDALTYAHGASLFQPPSFLGLRCGVAHIDHLTALLGVAEEKTGEDMHWVKSPWLERSGLKRLSVRLGANDRIARIQIDLAKGLTYEEVKSRMPLTGRAIDRERTAKGFIRVHPSQGVMLQFEGILVTRMLLYPEDGPAFTALQAPCAVDPKAGSAGAEQ